VVQAVLLAKRSRHPAARISFQAEVGGQSVVRLLSDLQLRKKLRHGLSYSVIGVRRGLQKKAETSLLTQLQ
jgi:hypothetical protein